MAGKIIDGDVVKLDRDELVNISKPLFYGYVFIAGISMLSVSTSYAGTLLGISGLAAITFVSAALAQGMEEDWSSFLDLIAITSLLMTVLFGSYTAASLSLGL